MALLGNGKFFAYTDTAAPVISTTAGTLITLLKQVLVNGYGTKDPLGWELAFEGTNIAVFKMGGGTRSYVKITDDNADANYARVQIYSTMTDINTGAEPLFGGTTDLGYLFKKFTWTTATLTGINAWYIIGDDRGFWLNLRTTANLDATYGVQGSHLIYIGEYNSISPAFSKTVCCIGSAFINASTTYRWPTAFYYGNTTNSIALMHNSAGEYAPHMGGVQSVLKTPFGHNYTVNGSNLPCYGYPILVMSGSTIMGQLPGIVDGFNKFVATTADMTAFRAERDALLIQDQSSNVLGFSCVHGYSNATGQYDQRYPYDASHSQRLTIKTGEGFRNVY